MVVFSESAAIDDNYDAVITSKAHFLAPDARETVGEFFAAQVHAAFSDELGMVVEIESDGGRHYETISFAEPADDHTDWPIAGQRIFRHSFDVVAREGLIGQFFKIKITKTIPTTGAFAYFGSDLEISPCPEYTPEFEIGLGALTRSY